jgi:hypothetical protein
MNPTLTVACISLKSAWQAVLLRSALTALLPSPQAAALHPWQRNVWAGENCKKSIALPNHSSVRRKGSCPKSPTDLLEIIHFPNPRPTDHEAATVNFLHPDPVFWTKSSTCPGVYGTNFWIESTETLTGTWTTETLGGNVTQNGNNITYTFPASAKRFVRLKVVGP